MVEQIVPILKISDAARAIEWYSRLGFEVEFEHRYSEEFPGYIGMVRNGTRIHLSEHVGDATPDTLVYMFVDNVDSLAGSLNAEVEEQPWAREIHLTDPDGNRLRIGTRVEADVSGN